jgi:hypothetical protein
MKMSNLLTLALLGGGAYYLYSQQQAAAAAATGAGTPGTPGASATPTPNTTGTPGTGTSPGTSPANTPPPGWTPPGGWGGATGPGNANLPNGNGPIPNAGPLPPMVQPPNGNGMTLPNFNPIPPAPNVPGIPSSGSGVITVSNQGNPPAVVVNSNGTNHIVIPPATGPVDPGFNLPAGAQQVGNVVVAKSTSPAAAKILVNTPVITMPFGMAHI